MADGKAVLQAQEFERRRIARELHDGAAQTLTNLVLRVEVCERLLATDPDRVRDELRRVKELLRASLRDIRQIIADLRPLVVEESGLEEALRRCAVEFGDRTGIAVRLHFPPSPVPVDSDVKLAVYRSVQECLNNVAKHSGASQASVRIETSDAELRVEVRDDGRGFECQEVQRAGRRFGLRAMRERLSLLGGWLQVDTAPGRGTAVRFGIPLEEHLGGQGGM
ncbi:MAG: sensor histidine kinase [Firmicutes bacterium]|nr:sensor histidine kinase [Bacillota bacterium]